MKLSMNRSRIAMVSTRFIFGSSMWRNTAQAPAPSILAAW